MEGYVLDKEGNPVKEPDMIKATLQNATTNKHIGKDDIEGVSISTVFLGFDHSFGGGEPLLFETMIFGGKHDEYQERYSTREEAIKGHKKAVKLVKKAQKHE